jgi:sugar/nucleoside kinase (ribokinase family)
MAQSFDAVVAGHICLDIFPDLSGSTPEQFHRTFAPGRLLQVGPISYCTGGPVSNTGLVLHKLGMRTQLMGKIGDDLFGQAVRQVVASFDPRPRPDRWGGLAEGMIVDAGVNTSYTIVINPPGADRFFLHCPGANDTFSAADVRYDLLAEARLFHFGYPPLMRLMYEDAGAQLVKIYRRARATDITTSLDMALPDPGSAAGQADWASILAATLPHVDVFLPSIEETLYMLRRETYDQLWRAADGPDILPLITPQLLSELGTELLGLGARIVGLKLGYRGFYLRTAGRPAIEALGRGRPSDPAAWADKELWAPCFKVNVVGTAGSGDSTIAGFLSGLLRDLTPEAALTAAVAVGACNVEAADTLSGIRPWDATMQRVAAGWARHELCLDAPGWHFNANHGLWMAGT